MNEGKDMRTQRKILFQVFAQNKGNIVNLLAVCIVVLVGLATFSSCSEQKEQLNNKRISDGKKDQKSVAPGKAWSVGIGGERATFEIR